MSGRVGTAVLVCCVALLLGAVLAAPPPLLRGWQERAFDPLTTTFAARDARVLTVDIGATDETGAPWDRAATARLIATMGASGAKVLAFDVVFAGDCGTAQTLDLARAMQAVPVVLGFLLGDRATLPPGPAGRIGVAGLPLWSAPGAEAPCPALVAASAGVGAVSLPGGVDAVVRMAPAGVAVGDVPFPGLAVAAVQRFAATDLPLIAAAGGGGSLRLGGHILPTDGEGFLRLAPAGAAVWDARRFDAGEVLRGGPVPTFEGALVFIGSSLPQRGGLRPTAAGPLSPSMQVQADLAAGLLVGRLPARAAKAVWAEAGFATAGGVLAGGLVLGLPLAAGLGAALLLALGWAAFAVLLHGATGGLFDPVFPGLAVLMTATLALTARAWTSGRAERRLRAKLGQLLPPEVVRRIAGNPRLFKLRGEVRVVTALTTDIEGFSETTRRVGPEALVELLDTYFALCCEIVLRHGGMIDKYVGDSVHALFNAPLDLPGHADAALDCAAEIARRTEDLRMQPEMQAAGLGRTRIGVETGPAVLGDVGSGARIDYTAHGEAVNLAARLEALNKDLGTTILIGPGTRAASRRALVSKGVLEVRSFGAVEVFTLA